MICGNCDEPSCQSLVDASDCLGLGSGTVNSTLTGNLTGTAVCSDGTIALTASTTWSVSMVNVGSSGSITFTDDFYTNSCGSCAAFQLNNANNGAAYYVTSGSGSWSNNSFAYTVDITDVLTATENYSVTGTIVCQ